MNDTQIPLNTHTYSDSGDMSSSSPSTVGAYVFAVSISLRHLKKLVIERFWNNKNDLTKTIQHKL